MRLGQTSVVYLIFSILSSLIGFLGTIYFTRTLGEEIYGYFVITLAVVSSLGIFKNIGIGNAIVKRMSEGKEPDKYITAGIITKAVFTIFIAAGVLVFSDFVNDYVGQSVAVFVILILIASILSSLVASALKGTHRVHIYAPLQTGKETFRTIIMIALVFFGWELTGMLLGHAIGTIAIAAVGFWIVRPQLSLPSKRHYCRLFDFAKYSWLGDMRKKSFQDADILVLGFFVSSGLTGIYAISYTLAKFLDIFGSAIRNTLFPEMSKLSTNQNTDMVATLTTDALSFAGLFLIPGVVGAAILGDRLMLVYGPSFDAGHWILVILLVGLIVYTYTKQLLNTLNAIDRPDLAFRANGAFIIANVALNVVLVWWIGWFGAAIATALSATVGFSLSLHYVRRFIDIQLPLNEIGLQWTAALVMGVIVYTGRSLGESTLAWVDDFNVIFAVLLVGLGAIVYFVVLLTISRRFQKTVERNLPFNIPIM